MEQNAFIITKLLQYINVNNIPDKSLRDLYVIPNFANKRNFLNIIKKKSYWKNIYLFKTKELALINILFNKKYNKIFIDSDFGILLRLILFFFNNKIFVYEEGLASYVSSVRSKKTFLNKIFKVIDYLSLGGKSSGSAFATKGIYLYHSNAFKNMTNSLSHKNFLKFQHSFIDNLNNQNQFLNLLFKKDFTFYKGKKVLLYICAGPINESIYPLMEKYKKYHKVFKPHPADVDVLDFKFSFDEILDPLFLSEYAILNILKFSESLVIVHESSAALLNLVNLNLNNVFNLTNTDYLEEFKLIKKNFLNNS